MSDQGKANYEGHRKAAGGKSAATGWPMPDWDELTQESRRAFDAGADAVEAWLADCPVDEDASGEPEPMPAKVVIVTEHGGRERHYAATGWDAEEAVDVTRDGLVIATYPPGAWTRIHRDGATLPDIAARQLGTAMQALREIAGTVMEADDKRGLVVAISRDALEQIEELDL